MFDVPAAWAPFVLAAIILGLTLLTSVLARLTVRGFLSGSSPLVSASAQRVAVVIVWVAGVVLALQTLGVSADILLLVVALLGVAGVIAARIPLENAGAKYFADVYTPFKRGDVVRAGGHEGRVIEINAMNTVLLTDDHRLVAVPNTLFLREPTVNLTPEAWKELVVSVSVPASTDLATFEGEALRGIGKLRSRLDPRYPPVFAVKSRSGQASELTLTVMIRRPEDREALLSEVHTRLSEALGKGRSAPSAPAAGARSDARG